MNERQSPHRNQRVVAAGRPLDQADAAVVMVHGRGATAESILTLAEEVGRPELAYLAPQAAGSTWYPYGFMAPMEQNEPWLSSALERLGSVLAKLESEGIPAERTVLLGFSQGACLTLEFAARHAKRYAGVVAFSGGLIGPPGTPRDYPGSLDGTPVFLGCSDIDPHIPEPRVRESAAHFARMGAQVECRIYPGMGHLVNEDELAFAKQLVDAVSA
jgi:predicted esterase